MPYNNKYTNMVKFYDLLMTDGYYDYERMAASLNEILKKHERKEILELGVGTGLVVERLLDLASYEITGVDYTSSMIEKAVQKIGGKARLFEENIISMQLDKKFDAAYSNGGVWYFIDTEESYSLCSHIPDKQLTFNSLSNVANHLKDDGLLLLSVQSTHYNFQKELSNGIIYAQEIEEDGDCFNKSYLFKCNGNILSEQICRYQLYDLDTAKKMFRDAKFKLTDIVNNTFFVFAKDS